MSKNVLLLAFQGELMCFAHALLHAQDLHENGFNVTIIIEGAATKLIPQLSEPSTPFHDLYQKVKDAGLIDCVCKACAAKMGTLPAAQQQNFTINGDVLGHPSLRRYIEEGYQVITF